MLSKYTKWLLIILGLAVALLLLFGGSSIDLRDDVIPLLAGGGVGVLLGAGLMLLDRQAANHPKAEQPADTAQPLPIASPSEAPMGLVNPWGDESVKQGEVFSYPHRAEIPKAESADTPSPHAADEDAKEVPAWMRQMPVFARMAAAMHETLDADATAPQPPENGQETAMDDLSSADTPDASEGQAERVADEEEPAFASWSEVDSQAERIADEEEPAAETRSESDSQAERVAIEENPAFAARSEADFMEEASLPPDPVTVEADAKDAVLQPEDASPVESPAVMQEAEAAEQDAPADEISTVLPEAVPEPAPGTPWWRTRSESAPWTLGHTVFPAQVQQDDVPTAETTATTVVDAGETVFGESPAVLDTVQPSATETTPMATEEAETPTLPREVTDTAPMVVEEAEPPVPPREVTETTVDVTATVGEFSYFSYPVTIAPQPEASEIAPAEESPDGEPQQAAEAADDEPETAQMTTESDDPEGTPSAEPEGEDQSAPDAATFSLMDADVPRLPVDDPLDEGRGYRSLLEELGDRRLHGAEYTAADFPWAVDRTVPSRPMMTPKPLPNIFDAAAWTQAEDTPEA